MAFFLSNLPEVSPAELVGWLAERPGLVLLDVREPWEVACAALPDSRVVHAPLSTLAAQGSQALPPAASDPQADLVVFCHLGQRSAQVSAWLIDQGYTRVFNLAGGLDAYAATADANIPRY
jgi:rhodanese-related sulfurtransferase